MNERDAFEMELAALKPQPPSAALKDRIAQQLENHPPAAPAPKELGALRIWQVSIALSIALAVLIIGRGHWTDGAGIKPMRQTSTDLDYSVALDPLLPTLWSFHRAALVSPEQLDALFDRQSRRTASRIRTSSSKSGLIPTLI